MRISRVHFLNCGWVVALCAIGCGSSPVGSFKRFIASEDKGSSYEPGQKVAGSDRFDVRKTDSLTAPYLGIHQVDVRFPVQEEKGITQPVKIQKTLRYEFMYRGDGSTWNLDEAYASVVEYDVLQDDRGIGESTRKGMLGKRVKIQ